jgi:hypothetical protein
VLRAAVGRSSVDGGRKSPETLLSAGDLAAGSDRPLAAVT